MKNDVFTNLVFMSTVYPLETTTIQGSTWIVPSPDADEKVYRINLISSITDLLVDFFKLGALIESKIDLASYHPLYLQDRVCGIVGSAIEDRKPSISYGGIFDDSESPFLQKDSELVINALLLFFNKFGGVENRDFQISLANDVAIHLFQTKKLSFCRVPVSELAYLVFEIYYRYANPDAYIDMCKTYPTRYLRGRLTEKPTLDIAMDIRTYYTKGIGWKEEKYIKSIFDLISLFLFCDQEIKIKKCIYCGAVFTTSNEAAVYCSPSCRNRANSKKSYERRKAREMEEAQSETEEK